ncbi:MAG: selenide, water dikinase SelD [Flavobacteriales bacterium]|nr:selenide, water dikinase SelD [Flavobacteriales bacterium]
MENIKLTAYSHGAGCGCKISPSMLAKILESNKANGVDFANTLLVGNQSMDDAAVVDIGDGKAIISTTDFFMPIVDDPFDFGRIAGVNAISDVYAMGGMPIMAVAILGWPINQLGPEVAGQVVDGGRQACADAGIPLAGGHSIDSPEPIFGLAVTGIVESDKMKENSTAERGSKLYLTKPLGVGILSTAQKKGLLEDQHKDIARNQMIQLNVFGAALAGVEGVNAVTDVTGFGLLGHLMEMCEGSDLNAVLDFENIPIIECATYYVEKGCVPGGTQRNWDSYGKKIGEISDLQRSLLCDPQTSGGLLISVSAETETEFLALSRVHGLELKPIGLLEVRSEGPYIQVN